jgi:hypothetical protein
MEQGIGEVGAPGLRFGLTASDAERVAATGSRQTSGCRRSCGCPPPSGGQHRPVIFGSCGTRQDRRGEPAPFTVTRVGRAHSAPDRCTLPGVADADDPPPRAPGRAPPDLAALPRRPHQHAAKECINTANVDWRRQKRGSSRHTIPIFACDRSSSGSHRAVTVAPVRASLREPMRRRPALTRLLNRSEYLHEVGSRCTADTLHTDPRPHRQHICTTSATALRRRPTGSCSAASASTSALHAPNATCAERCGTPGIPVRTLATLSASAHSWSRSAHPRPGPSATDFGGAPSSAQPRSAAEPRCRPPSSPRPAPSAWARWERRLSRATLPDTQNHHHTQRAPRRSAGQPAGPRSREWSTADRAGLETSSWPCTLNGLLGLIYRSG